MCLQSVRAMTLHFNSLKSKVEDVKVHCAREKDIFAVVVMNAVTLNSCHTPRALVKNIHNCSAASSQLHL